MKAYVKAHVLHPAMYLRREKHVAGPPARCSNHSSACFLETSIVQNSIHAVRFQCLQGPSPEVEIFCNCACADSSTRACVQLNIKGMHCASCSGAIEKALLQLPGVTQAAVNLLAESAEVSYLPGRVTAKEIAEEVDDCGFEASVRLLPWLPDCLFGCMRTLNIKTAVHSVHLQASCNCTVWQLPPASTDAHPLTATWGTTGPREPKSGPK